MKDKKKILYLCMLEGAFLLYSIQSVLSKIASGYDPMSLPFLMFYAGIVMLLGIYALLWQQVIKHFDLSVAYANKAVTLLWAIVWSIVIFREKIRPGQVIGILIVMAGIFLLNSGDKTGSEGKEEEE